MQTIVLVPLLTLLCTVLCQPLDLEIHSSVADSNTDRVQPHHLRKRFINPMFAFGGAADSGVNKMRTKREAGDDCEKLALCKLHARSHRSFFATFQLYFVNKENARLWDHQSRSMADCEARYGDCYDE